MELLIAILSSVSREILSSSPKVHQLPLWSNCTQMLLKMLFTKRSSKVFVSVKQRFCYSIVILKLFIYNLDFMKTGLADTL